MCLPFNSAIDIAIDMIGIDMIGIDMIDISYHMILSHGYEMFFLKGMIYILSY